MLNVERLEEALEAGAYDVEALRSRRLVSGCHPVKILGKGMLTKKLTLTVHAASKGARATVEKAGGKIIIVGSTTRNPKANT